MIWADRISLALAIFIALSAALLAIIVFIGVGTYGDARLDTAMLLWTGIAELVIVIPLWVLLRITDLFAGGRTRRRRKRQAADREDRREPQMATASAGGHDLRK